MYISLYNIIYIDISLRLSVCISLVFPINQRHGFVHESILKMMDLLTNNNRPAGDGLISKTVDGIHEQSKYSPEIGFFQLYLTLSIYHGDSTNPNFGEAVKPQFCGWTCFSQVAAVGMDFDGICRLCKPFM